MNLNKAFGLTALFLAVTGASAAYADPATCVPERCLEKRSFFHFSKGHMLPKEVKTNCAGVVDHWQNHPLDSDPANASNIYNGNFNNFDHCTNASSIYP